MVRKERSKRLCDAIGSARGVAKWFGQERKKKTTDGLAVERDGIQEFINLGSQPQKRNHHPITTRGHSEWRGEDTAWPGKSVVYTNPSNEDIGGGQATNQEPRRSTSRYGATVVGQTQDVCEGYHPQASAQRGRGGWVCPPVIGRADAGIRKETVAWEFLGHSLTWTLCRRLTRQMPIGLGAAVSDPSLCRLTALWEPDGPVLMRQSLIYPGCRKQSGQSMRSSSFLPLPGNDIGIPALKQPLSRSVPGTVAQGYLPTVALSLEPCYAQHNSGGGARLAPHFNPRPAKAVRLGFGMHAGEKNDHTTQALAILGVTPPRLHTSSRQSWGCAIIFRAVCGGHSPSCAIFRGENQQQQK